MTKTAIIQAWEELPEEQILQMRIRDFGLKVALFLCGATQKLKANPNRMLFEHSAGVGDVTHLIYMPERARRTIS